MITDGWTVLGGSPTGISSSYWDADPRTLRGVNPAIAAYDAGVKLGAIPIAAPVAAFLPNAPSSALVYSTPVEGVAAADGASVRRLGASGTIDAPQRDLFATLARKISTPAPGGTSAPQGVNARTLRQGAPLSPSLIISPGYIAGKLPPVGSGVSGAQLLPGRGQIVTPGSVPQGGLILLALVAVGVFLALKA